MKLYKAKEIAEMFQISIGTVYRLGREGKLKAVRFGRTVRYSLEGSYESDEDNRKHHRSCDRNGNAHGDSCGNGYSYSGKLGG